MALIDISYHRLLDKILSVGHTYNDPNRKDVTRLEVLSHIYRHSFSNGFPAISTKELFYNNVVIELLWFLKGDTNIKFLLKNGCNIWNKDAYKYYIKKCKEFGKECVSASGFITLVRCGDLLDFGDYKGGDLGPVYGHQWRKGGDTDQFIDLIFNLINRPMATDHIVNSWNVSQLKDMALEPCHYGFQVLVRPLSELEKVIYLTDYGFELHWSQRSVDTFLGLPYNIASYATLAKIIEELTGYKALAIQGDLKKVHLYDNSLSAVNEQLDRDSDKYDKCELMLSDELETSFSKFRDSKTDSVILNNFINQLKISDFRLTNYQSYPHIKVEMLERNE